MSLDDFTDLSPATIAVNTDQVQHVWQPTIAGPISAKDLGQAAYYQWGKEWLTVSPVVNRGQFTDIQKAINKAAQAGGGSIVLLAGSYTSLALNVPSSFPLEIEGENKYTVILKNAIGSNCFRLGANYNTRFKLNNMTYVSQNTTAVGSFFLVATQALDNYDIALQEINYTLMNTTATNSQTGDRFLQFTSPITTSINKNFIRLANINGTGGRYFIIDDDYGNVDISECKISGNIFDPISIASYIQNVQNCKLINCGGGITLTRSARASIKGNVWSGAFADWVNSRVIYTECNQADIVGNKIITTGMQTTQTGFIGIQINSNYGIIGDNVINYQVNATNVFRGISIGAGDNVVSGNVILCENSLGATNDIGINVDRQRNIISDNYINMFSTTTRQIGINLTASSGHNVGSNNLIYQSGASVIDVGASNAVTCKHVT